jgi:hypothetical protein
MASAVFLRVVLVRHGQSKNNVLMDVRYGARRFRWGADQILHCIGGAPPANRAGTRRLCSLQVA